jgi:hypothetical protein
MDRRLAGRQGGGPYRAGQLGNSLVRVGFSGLEIRIPAFVSQPAKHWNVVPFAALDNARTMAPFLGQNDRRAGLN